MQRLIPLMQREWLQHRNGWLLMAGVPLGLSLLLLSFGQIQIDVGEMNAAGAALPSLMAAASIGGSMAVIFLIATFSSLVIVSNLARRDHADRSVEFWLSLPVSHSASFASPLIVHLLLVPAAALVIGMLGGYAVSFIVVSRVVGSGAWFGLPWGTLIAASFSLMLRLLAGLPLAMLWLSPLILLVVLLTAWFRRWGWVILTVGLGLGSYLLKLVFGQPWLNRISGDLMKAAAHALINGDQGGFVVSQASQGVDALRLLPGWALEDFGAALHALATPLFPGALLFAAGCFFLLVQWRQRGAGAAG
jgi:hypothetical protein